jgi:hypothetical protein
MSNRYSDWLTFDEVEIAAPEDPGLFQIKLREGLLAYPSGKSAMVYYGYSENLYEGLTYFRNAYLPFIELAEDVIVVRYMPAPDFEARFKKHLGFFHNNFGSMPLGNEIILQKQAEQES